jgi:hypothetical protein
VITHQVANVWLRNVVRVTQVNHPLYFLDGSVPVHNLCNVIQKVLHLRIDWRRHYRRTLIDAVHTEFADIPGREPVATEGTLRLHPVEASGTFLILVPCDVSFSGTLTLDKRCDHK